MGSGTVAAVCEKLGRRWIGIDLSEQYCEIAVRRIEQARKQTIIPQFLTGG
jgi:site-specific DNA-methyltransferase (adenine-specific)